MRNSSVCSDANFRPKRCCRQPALIRTNKRFRFVRIFAFCCKNSKTFVTTKPRRPYSNCTTAHRWIARKSFQFKFAMSMTRQIWQKLSPTNTSTVSYSIMPETIWLCSKSSSKILITRKSVKTKKCLSSHLLAMQVVWQDFAPVSALSASSKLFTIVSTILFILFGEKFDQTKLLFYLYTRHTMSCLKNTILLLNLMNEQKLIASFLLVRFFINLQKHKYYFVKCFDSNSSITKIVNCLWFFEYY